MSSMIERWHAFRQWQQRPHEVAPMTDEHHCCHTCGQEFQGNYCPRCGQSARIGRYSFKNALLLFLDVWGLGNRGMFRTLRDLLLRPGYMIRDYLSGMQMAYFPPFKLFFLLTTLSLVVEAGVNVRHQNYFETSREQLRKGFGDSFAEDAAGTPLSKEEQEINRQTEVMGYKLMDFAQKFPNIMTLSALLVMSGFLYIFFRRSPHIPDLRFSELLIALVYITNMYSIYNIVLEFLCVPTEVIYVSMLLPLIPLRQMSGFSWWRLLLIMLFVFVMLCLTCCLVGALSTMTYMLFSHH